MWTLSHFLSDLTCRPGFHVLPSWRCIILYFHVEKCGRNQRNLVLMFADLTEKTCVVFSGCRCAFVLLTPWRWRWWTAQPPGTTGSCTWRWRGARSLWLCWWSATWTRPRIQTGGRTGRRRPPPQRSGPLPGTRRWIPPPACRPQTQTCCREPGGEGRDARLMRLSLKLFSWVHEGDDAATYCTEGSGFKQHGLGTKSRTSCFNYSIKVKILQQKAHFVKKLRPCKYFFWAFFPWFFVCFFLFTTNKLWFLDKKLLLFFNEFYVKVFFILKSFLFFLRQKVSILENF